MATESPGEFELFCLVHGEWEGSDIFSVHIEQSASVSSLRSAIKTERDNIFGEIDQVKLILYHVSIPDDTSDLKTFVDGLTLPTPLKPTSSLSKIFTSAPPNDMIHILIKVRQVPPTVAMVPGVTSEEHGTVGYFKLWSDQFKSLNTMSPSTFAQPSNYISKIGPNNIEREAILCNRPIDYTSVPLTLLCSIFGRFEDDYQDTPKSNLGPRICQATRQLADDMARFYTFGTARQDAFISWLQNTYGVSLGTSIGKFWLGGHFAHPMGVEVGNRFLVLVTEGQNEVGAATSEGHVEGLMYYRAFYQKFAASNASDLGRHGCLPAILLTYQGPFVDASGLIMHHDGTVQMEPLTCAMRMDCDWRNDYHRYMIARFIWALDEAIKSLKQFYDQAPGDPSPSYNHLLPSVLKEGPRAAKKRIQAIECLYPYPQSYAKLGSEGVTIPFKYVRRMFADRLLFQAVEVGTQRQILIKFTRRYAAEMHELLARKHLAPELYGCQGMPGGWKMIAMEFLPIEDWVTLDCMQDLGKYKSKIGQALDDLLWKDQWVHGDIRHHNILVPKSGEVDFRLTDFDYAGKEDVDTYPRDWNDTFRPQGAVSGAVLKVEHDRIMLGDLFAHQRCLFAMYE